jgi:hypothetical protein
MSKGWQAGAITAVATLGLVLGGCSSQSSRVEHYVSPQAQVQGESQKINLEEVQKAFWDSKSGSAKDFNTWMAAFEKRVNEIYDGKEVVSVDATRKEGKLVVVGYIDQKKQPGFVDGDEKLFTIEQTGDAVNNEMPYRVSGYDNRPYYEGHRSILDNPFLQMMLISHFMGGGWGGRYYTPYSQVGILGGYRDTYRATPQYAQQQASNQGFFSRFKKNSAGGLQSTKGFGGGDFSSSSQPTKRNWFGGTGSPTGSAASSATSSATSSGWGGRRSSGSGIFGGGGMRSSGRSWGGFRRR